MFDVSTRVFVAGHRGLLGSALLRQLEDRGHKNLVVRTHDQVDLTSQKATMDFFAAEKPAVVFLAAGKAGGIASNLKHPATYLHTNVAIQDNVFEAAVAHGVEHVVFFGSTCTYPKICEQPMKEGHWLSGPIEPTSKGYAAAKIAGILACQSYNQEFGGNRFICLVPNTLYGPNDHFSEAHSHVISAVMRRMHEAKLNGTPEITLWGTGSPRREFVHADDVASAAIFAVKNQHRLENRFYNVGNGEDCSIKDLAGHLAGIVGYNGKVIFDTTKPDGTPRKLLDSSDFQALGWKAQINLEDGLRGMYHWYLEHTHGQRV